MRVFLGPIRPKFWNTNHIASEFPEKGSKSNFFGRIRAIFFFKIMNFCQRFVRHSNSKHICASNNNEDILTKIWKPVRRCFQIRRFVTLRSFIKTSRFLFKKYTRFYQNIFRKRISYYAGQDFPRARGVRPIGGKYSEP